MNETGMASDEWHKANDHLKFLITEDYISIERKDLESQECGHYSGFMILSNHDSPIQVKEGDGRIVCLDVSARCKGNFQYFKRLDEILDHLDTSRSFIAYLLSLDVPKDWHPHDLPVTKMKTEMM